MASTQSTVLYEKSLDLDLLAEISHVPGAEKSRSCIQCGTCSGSCPVAWAMQDTPRKVFALFRAGMRERVLDGTSIWTCASCYQCAERCPQKIKITEVMYALKRRAIRESRKHGRAAQALSVRFVDLVSKYGRNQETWLMVGFMMSSLPAGAALREVPLGMKLMARGRLPFGARPIREIESLRRIIAKAEELGGEE